MSKIHSYDDFLNEEFFKRLFGKKNIKKKSSIDSCVDEIISFLNDNEIYNWDDLIYSKKTDKYIINKLIDSSTNSMKDVDEIRFKLRLELSSRNQLREYLKELEMEENYERCSKVLKKMNEK